MDWCTPQVVHARARRRFNCSLKRKPLGLVKKLRKAKREAPPNEKPAVVKTHLRDMIIVPEMIGSVVGIYNGKVRAEPGLVDVWDPPQYDVIRFSTRSKSSRR
jgi:ribosomal protein uS19